ncbi:MAG: hypothetical protein ACRD98_00230 [Nitrososphaera sp.]
MPTPLKPFTIPGPGVFGLNTQGDVTTDSFDWATTADNCVYDEFGRLTSRKGWVKLTATPLAGAPNMNQLFEYKVNSSLTIIISAAGNKLYHGTTTLTEITGALTPTGDDWNFQNFNGKVVGWQAGHTPIVWANTGNFANIVVSDGGTLPDGPACLSAFGRMWAFDDDRTTLRYSGLLNETQWAVASGGGSIDLRSNKAAAHTGLDFGVALAEFNGRLIVLMSNTVLIYTGASDPTTMVLEDVLPGMGSAARDSVQSIGNDLLWLDRSGVVGLVRALESGSMPNRTYTERVRDDLQAELFSSGIGPIRSCYNKKDGFYGLAGDPFVWVFDTKAPLEDGTFRATKWNSIEPRSWHFASDNKLYLAKDGVVAEYTGYQDNAASYVMKWVSNWSRMGSEQIKIIKKIEAILSHIGQYTPTFSLGYDYVSGVFTVRAVSGTTGGVSEWNVAEWGIGEWGAVKAHNRVRVNGGKDGTYVQVGIQSGINSQSLSIQNLRLLFKLGRISR